ncbi:MAG: PCMD domain-containing protein [Parabacteroides sp.]
MIWRVKCCLLGLFSCLGLCLQAQEKVVEIPFGNLDQWIVREIYESKVIGGETKHLYEVGPRDTIRGNVAYTNQGGSPWATSNVYAKVAGVVKTNNSVFPERRGNGWCARMETRFEKVKVMGLVNIEVIAAGSLLLGEIHEPIRGTKDPQSMLLSGIPFTQRPKAIRFDYKTKTFPRQNRIRSTGFSRQSEVPGADSISVVLLLQKRWEDKEGKVYSKRVGTMVVRFTETTDWVNDATFPVLYGDITRRAEYRPYMRLQEEDRCTTNSRGEAVVIQEVGWAEADEKPTHMVLQFVSSHGGAYIGTVGTTLWVDNIRLIY